MKHIDGGVGGGVICVAAKSYSGGVIADVSCGIGWYTTAENGSAGTAKIFQINIDGSLTQRSFADSW